MKFLYTSARVPGSDLSAVAEKLRPYIQHMQEVVKSGSYDFPESSINLPSDVGLQAKVAEMIKQKVSKELRYVIVVGIGGSNLGAKAVYDALYGMFDVVEPHRFPKLIWMDTTDPEFASHVAALLSKAALKPAEILVNVISKSGGTMETIANAEFLFSVLEPLLSNVWDRVVVTTDEGSPLHSIASSKQIATLPIPKVVGGRYSVFSPVGLFPLAAVGISIQEFCAGATKMRELGISDTLETNPALLSACTQYYHLLKGKPISVSFFFHPELESVGKWYRQLMAESLGKEHDIDGNKVDTGITPTVALGSTDLHSIGQLYLGGPKDKVTTFIYTEQTEASPSVPMKVEFSRLTEGLINRSFSEVMQAIYEGVKKAYTKQELPFVEVLLSRVDAHSMGEFMQFKMLEVMYLGHLMNVDAFDQPHVELYKTETQKILRAHMKNS
jgi:glucose-6-phosphate isomerase